MRQYIDTLQDANGNALVGATVLVQNYVGGGNASIFSDNGLTPILTSTVATGADGQFSFFAADGDYSLVLAKNSTVFKTQSPVSMFDGAAQVTVNDVGASNAVSTLSSVLEKALRTGLRSYVKIAATNTGASTYQYNGLAAKAIVNVDGSALSSGQLVANGIYAMEYNGTAWQLAAPPAPSYYGITPTEQLTPVSTPTAFAQPPGNAFRYGVDPTGTTDASASGALQKWINSGWAALQYASPWNGAGGAVPILNLPPSRVKVSASTLIPCNVTVTGNAHPGGNTESHTRIIMNSTGITPGRSWSAGAKILASSVIVPNPTNGYYYQSGAGTGTTGGSQPVWPTVPGNTVGDNGITWTCVAATTAGDNRNIPMFKFSRAVSPSTYPSGGVLADASLNTTIQNLEFWYVTPGSSFNSPLSGAGMQLGDYPLGGTMYFDVTTTDTRIVSCVFQNTPCALRLNNVNSGVNVQGDGFNYGGGINLWVEECEFDAAGAHVWATNCNLDLVFRNCAFFGGVHKYTNCTGRVVYENCRFYGGAYIDAADSSNALTLMRLAGGEFDWATAYDSVSAYGCTILDVKGVSFVGASGTSGIVASNCNGGAIQGNSLNDSGFNASAGSSLANFVAAIKLLDCQNMLVSGNNITATDAASYNGFGILTGGVGRGSTNNFIEGNAVSGTYAGAVFNAQYRYVNLASTDIRGMNYEGRSSGVGMYTGRFAAPIVTLTIAASTVIDLSQGDEFDALFSTNATTVIANPINPIVGQKFWLFIKNTSGGNLTGITFGTLYKNVAFNGPVNGGSAALCFRWDGTNATAITPQTSSVPN